MRFVPVPRILFARHMRVEQRLVLKFVAAEAPGEGVLGPDDLAAHFEAGGLERVLELPLP